MTTKKYEAGPRQTVEVEQNVPAGRSRIAVRQGSELLMLSDEQARDLAAALDYALFEADIKHDEKTLMGLWVATC